MPEERFVKTKLTLHIIQTTGILIAVLSFWMNYIGIREQHEWNRRQQTFILINEVNKQLADIRDPLMKAFPDIYSDKETTKLSRQDAENLFNACSSQQPQGTKGRKFTCEARGVGGKYLNFLEYISVAYVNYIGDRPMIEASLGGMLVNEYDYFENFIEHVGKMRSRKAWEPLQKAVAIIKSKNITAGPRPTG